MKIASRWLWAVACCAALASCDKGDTGALRTLSDKPPLALENGLLYLATEPNDEHTALLLDVARAQARLSVHKLPEGEVELYPRPAHEGQVLLLTEGRPAELVDGRGRDAVDSFVLLYDRAGEQQRFQLSGRYGELAISGDGRFVLAFAPSGSWSTADSVAVLDLERDDPAQKVPAITVRALNGAGPSRVQFSPTDGSRRLAVLVMSDAVNLLDLENPEHKDKVLPLKLPDGSNQLRADKVLFHGDRIFIQPSQGNDVLVVRLDEDAESTSGFRASLSSLTTEAEVLDIALVEDAAGVRLVTLGPGKLRLIDTTTGDGESSNVGGSLSALHVFSGSSPFDADVKPRALLYGASVSQLGFVDLQRSLPGNERTLDLLTLSQGLREIAFSRQLPLAVVTGSAGNVSIVDLAERTVSTVTTEGSAKQLLLEERGGSSRAWITTEAGQIGVIDLANRGPSGLLLDHPAQRVVPIFGDTSLVAVTHATDSGRITLVDAQQPSRESAREVAGFLFSRFLD